MKIYIDNESLKYDFEHIFRIFSPVNPKVIITKLPGNIDYKENSFEILLNHSETKIIRGFYNEKLYESKLFSTDKNSIKREFYKILCEIFNTSSPFGFLVGVRPVKIVHELMDKGTTDQEIEKILKSDYMIRDDKVDLLIEVANRERKAAFPINPESISVYVGIPFCKTRCYYCSFTSLLSETSRSLIDDYLDALKKEISVLLDYLKKEEKEIDLLYIGGGTPTAISPKALKSVIDVLKEKLDMSRIKEFTIEAGRPDTIDDEMLQVLYDSGCDRICVNPQTMCDKTLDIIGRSHDSKDIVDLMNKIDKERIPTINMDIIAGLQNETIEDFNHTLEEIVSLEPDNITVHTLSIKRGSKLNENFEEFNMTGEKTIEEMVELSQKFLRQAGYIPYYMYRQKNILANLENVGYAKPGKECIYNVKIMAEQNTFLGLGAGATSKFYFGNNLFHRFSNSKGVHDYINRIDELIEKKLTKLEEIFNSSIGGI